MAKTVLLTGISGFIAKRIALDLLLAGHSVVGTVRSAGREAEVRATLGANVPEPAVLERLRFVVLDLNQDAGWPEAMRGIDAVIHTASPFPIAQPKDENELIRPAVEGTLRVLKAAQVVGLVRVILTSSLEAMQHGTKSGPISEADWSDLTAPTITAYAKSKTLAETAAWDFAAAHPEMQLTSINPGLVLGEPLDRHYGSSIGVIGRFLGGKDPMVADFSVPVVDIGDVSRAHLCALEQPETIGQRYVCAETYMSIPAITRILKASYPAKRIATRIAPKFLIRFLALFDAEIRTILPLIGLHPTLNNAKARRDLGLHFVPAADALRRSAAYIMAKPV